MSCQGPRRSDNTNLKDPPGQHHILGMASVTAGGARTLVRSSVRTPPDSRLVCADGACCGLKSALRPPSLTGYYSGVCFEMDSPFGEDRLALLFVQRSGCRRLPHLTTQLVESSRTEDHQRPSGHIVGVAKLVGHVSRNHD